MLDATRIWKAGTPTTVLAWDSFASAAHGHAKTQGVAQLPVVVVPRRFPVHTDDDQRAKAEAVFEELFKTLTTLAAGDVPRDGNATGDDGGAAPEGRPLRSAAGYEEALELFFDRHWTDGLPVAIPTPDLVDRMLQASSLDPKTSLGQVPPRGAEATVELVAINAVMAGCRPEYFPIVLKATELILRPEFNIGGVCTTTHSSAPLTIVHGPLAMELGFNGKEVVFGNGYRANGTVGRAITLVLWNLGGAFPWTVGRSSESHPGRWTYCIAEDEENSPWTPFHVERGCPEGSSAVTVFAGEAPQGIMPCYGNPTEMIHAILGSISTLGNNNTRHGGGQLILVLNCQTALQFHQQGWTKKDIQREVWSRATHRVAELDALGPIQRQRIRLARSAKESPDWVNWSDPEYELHLTDRPEDILILVAGGASYGAAVVHGWGRNGGLATTEILGSRE